MKPGSHKKIELGLIGLALVFFSLFTVARYAPEHSHADILINSVMSLQNVTLFYWGQNRLLNVLPFIAAIFNDPVFNLRLVLFFPALCHFSLLLFFSMITKEIGGDDGQGYVVLKVFVILSAIFLALFNDGDIFNIAIGHIEYSLPVLLVGISFLLAVKKQWGFSAWLGLTVFLVTVATGLNFSIVLLSLFLVFSHLAYTRKIERRIFFFCLVSIVAFVFWNYVSRQYGDLPYSQFNLNQLRPGLDLVLKNLLSSLDLLNLVLVVLIFLGFNLCRPLLNCRSSYDSRNLPGYFMMVAGLFGIGWLLLFSSSKWVALNLFSYRYFTFFLYGILAYAACETYRVVSLVGARTSWGISGISAIFSFFILWSSFFPFGEYKIFKNVESLSAGYHGLYAGNYWDVWPAVLRDLMNGHTAYGLAHRGEGNREEARMLAAGQLSRDGFISVLCLKDTALNCVHQVSGVIGPVFLEEILPRDEMVNVLRLTQSTAGLVYKDGDFAALPSNAGGMVHNAKVSNGTSGCLFFGPYVPIRAGRYALNVYGNSRFVKTAIADIASRHGGIVHAKFPIPGMTKQILVRNAVLDIPEGVNDLEVRLCVSEVDDLEVTGYELQLYKN